MIINNPLVYVFAFVVVSHALGTSIFERSLKHASLGMKRAQNEILSRNKRGFMDMLPNIIQCSASCVLPLVTLMIEQNFGTPSYQQFAQMRQEMGMFHEVCKVYQNASDCANSCRSQSFRETIRSMTTVPRFVCVERYQDFQRHLPCLSQVTNESETQCAAQCAHYDTLMSQLNASHVFNRPGGEMFTDLVRQSCEYSACNIECQKQLVANRCGVDAQRLVQDMVQLSVNSVELLSDSVGFPFTMPSQCRNIEHGSSSYSSSSSSPVGPSPYNPQPTYSPNSVQGQTFYQNQRYHHSQGFSGSNQDYWQARGYQPVPPPANPPNTYPDNNNVYRRNNSPFFNPANDQQPIVQNNQRNGYRG